MAKKPKQPLYHAVEGLSSRDREPSDSNPLYITPNRNAGASCGGEVIITCCGDKTHPYLPGEWITVEVKH